MKQFILALLIIVVSFSCGKDNNNNGIAITGTWTFRSQISGVFRYPYNNLQPGWNEALGASVIVSNCQCNGLYVKFDNMGKYILVGSFGGSPVFTTGTPPIPHIDTAYGTYKVISDSLIVVQSDTTFLKSTYGYRANFPFPNGDSIRFRKISADSLQLIQHWTAPYKDIVHDSIMPASYLSISGFKKIQ